MEDAEARRALERVLAGPLRRSARGAAFLRYVVDESLAGRGSALRERAIGVAALGRGEDFDPRLDPAVRVQARRVRAALTRHYAGAGAADPVRIILPVGGYAPVFTRAPVRTGPGPEPLTRGPGVVVLALEDLGPAGEPIAPWLTELLVAELSRFPGLRVIGPVRPGAGAADPRTLGAGHGAEFVLVGSVRPQDDVLHAVIRLVDTRSGATVWSRALREQGTRAEAAAAVVRAVVPRLGDHYGVVARALGPPRRSPGALEAMQAYWAIHADLDPTRLEPVTAALQAALGREPDNALLLAMLADITMWAAEEGLGDRPRTAEEAEDLARRAIALDPANALAHVALAWSMRIQGRDEECRALCARVVELGPDHPYHLLAAGIDLAYTGCWDEGIALVRRSLRLNPDRPDWIRVVLAFDHLRRDEDELALAEGRQVHTPSFALGPVVRAVALARLGRHDEARRELDAARVLAPVLGRDPAQALAGVLVPPELRPRILADLAAIRPPG